MNRRAAPARRLFVPGVLLLAASFAFVGCAKGTDAKTGPISSRWNAVYGDESSWEDQWASDNARYEEVVARCMKEKGFEYTPVPAGVNGGMTVVGGDDEYDPVAEAKENGYWITPASMDELLMNYGLGDPEDFPEDLVDDSGSWFAEGDPNGPYYRSLSASDQAAYDEALYGPPLDEDDYDAEYEWDWTTAGCSGEASHQVYDLDQTDDSEVDSTVMDDFYTYAEDKITNDSRVRQAEAAWASCMAGKGYDFARSDEARQSIQQRFDDLTGADSNSDTWTPPDPDRFSAAELTDLHDDEIATATADAQCYVKSGMDAAVEAAYFDVETEFYSSHKAEVDAYFDALEAAQKKS